MLNLLEKLKSIKKVLCLMFILFQNEKHFAHHLHNVHTTVLFFIKRALLNEKFSFNSNPFSSNCNIAPSKMLILRWYIACLLLNFLEHSVLILRKFVIFVGKSLIDSFEMLSCRIFELLVYVYLGSINFHPTTQNFLPMLSK